MNRSHDIYFSLGSNLGDRFSNLKFAISEMCAFFQMISSSTIYETDSWGYEDENAYLNMVARFETNKTPLEILEIIKAIERHAGRIFYKKKHELDYQSRILDIDLLFYDNLIFSDSKITIPHPRLHLRNFVLIPFAEINDSFVHPVFNKTMGQLALDSPDKSEITRFDRAI